MLLLYLKTLLRQLLLPPASPLLLVVLGLLLLRRRPAAARVLIAVGFGTLWILATPVVAGALIHAIERYPPLDLQRIGDAQAVVILGGGQHRAWAPEYRAPSADGELLDRLAYGAYVSRRASLPILVTGFGVEADAMRATLRQNFDLTPRWIDALAYDTFENARNSAALLQREGIARIVLITSATHMRRSVNEFSAAGFTVVPAPVDTHPPEPAHAWDFVPSAYALYVSYLALYEFVGEPARELLAALHLRRQQS